jgi:hypothetical protein
MVTGNYVVCVLSQKYHIHIFSHFCCTIEAVYICLRSLPINECTLTLDRSYVLVLAASKPSLLIVAGGWVM